MRELAADCLNRSRGGAQLLGLEQLQGVEGRGHTAGVNLQKLPIEDLLSEVEAELKRDGLWKEEWATGAGHEWFSKAVDLLRPRVRLLPDFASWSRAFFSDEFTIDPAAKAKFWKDEKVPSLLASLADALAALSEWNHDACDHVSRKVADSIVTRREGPGSAGGAVTEREPSVASDARTQRLLLRRTSN